MLRKGALQLPETAAQAINPMAISPWTFEPREAFSKRKLLKVDRGTQVRARSTLPLKGGEG